MAPRLLALALDPPGWCERSDPVDSTIFDRVARDVARSGSRRRVVQALAAGAGLAIVTRAPVLADPGLKPIRCIKRGESCLVGATRCCGGKRAECVDGTCVRIGILK
jgi:hypothetical protein